MNTSMDILRVKYEFGPNTSMDILGVKYEFGLSVFYLFGPSVKKFGPLVFYLFGPRDSVYRTSSDVTNKCVNFVNQMYFHFTMEGSLVNKRELLALHLSGTYCHKTITRPSSCQLLNN